MQRREPAWRVFAYELNAARTELRSESGTRQPVYILTPLGARIRRVFVTGVLTEVQNRGDDGDPFWQARLTDPTGVFSLRAGSYQPQPSKLLGSVTPPLFLSVVGKARSYRPDEDRIYIDLWPERIRVVERGTRDFWTLEAARATIGRVKAFDIYRRLQQGEYVDANARRTVPQRLREGIELAHRHYGVPNLQRYSGVVAGVLRDIGAAVSGGTDSATADQEKGCGSRSVPASAGPKSVSKEADAKNSTPTPTPEMLEERVLEIIRTIEEGTLGSAYDVVIDNAVERGLTPATVDEAMDRLLAKGLIYEPMLGRLRTT